MVTIKQLIELADGDSRLLGAIQELQQYRENPFTNLQPCWKYVQQNSYGQQIDHIIGEIQEVNNAFKLDDIEMECFDVLQSAVTLMYILKTKYRTDLHELVKSGQVKNLKRGYYSRT